MPVTQYDINQFMAITDDGGSLNFWDADFRNLNLIISATETVLVDAEWSYNLPGLAAKKLGSRHLWWVLMVYNGLSDPINDVVPGVTLAIPDRHRLLAFLEATKAARATANITNGGTLTTL